VSLSKSYWLNAFVILLFATVFFLLFKNFLPEKLFPDTVKESEHIVVDEWMQKALIEEEVQNKDTVEGKPLKTVKEIILDAEKIASKDSLTSKFVETQNEPEVTPIEDKGFEKDIYLNNFFHNLSALEEQPETRKLRIAYFGDSMTDGDMIVQDLRKLFQTEFGGEGVGFVPIISESASSRGSIKHSFSNNWMMRTYMKTYDTIYPYGVNGQVFYQIDSVLPTYLYLSSGLYAKGKALKNSKLYYGKAKTNDAKIVVKTPNDTIEKLLDPLQKVNIISLSQNPTQSLDIEFVGTDSIPFYGVNFDSPNGIIIDNYSSRGNSGLPITQLNVQLMREFQKSLHYDLIVLHYGTNVLSSGNFNYSWYQSRMERVVDHLRSSFPQTSILVISIADKATKYETKMQTDSAVAYLLGSQRAFAKNKKTGFIDLFHLMGGENSMVEWVESEPEKANKDYTHFNHRGAKHIAKLIYNEIKKEFKIYKKQQLALELEKEKQRIQDSIQEAKEKEAIELQRLNEEQQEKDTVHVSKK